MKRHLTKRRGLLILTLLLTILSDIILSGGTVLNQILIDAVLALDAAELSVLIPTLLLYALLEGLVYVASSVSQSLFSAKLTDDMRRAVFSGVLRRRRKDFTEVNYSDYISAITGDLTILQRQYLGMLFLVVIFGGSMILSAALMFYYQPVVAVAALGCAAIMTLIPMALGDRLQKWEKAYSGKLAGLTTCLTELLSGFQVICSFGIRTHAESVFRRCSEELKNAEYKAEGLSALSEGSAQLLSGTAQSAILALACFMVFHGRMTMGALVAFITLNQNFCSALSMVLRGIPMLRGVQPVIERVNALADYTPLQEGGHTPSFQRHLEVSELSFQYRENAPVLRNLSLAIRPGEKCALTGGSGSGKTTLIRLLTGELDGYSGEIRYDGAELRTLDREAICSITAVIHQDVFLFDDTIRNNICLFQPFSEEAFDRAIRLSGVERFLSQFPEGAEYQVGQRGEFLSGGQRQRIAIARALIRDTPFLILDEGTSSLDIQTAEEIESELLSIPGLTLLTITHHLQNPQQYDQIIRLGD